MLLKTTTGIFAGLALFAFAGLTPVSADYSFEISGNGAFSDNTIRFNSEKNLTVSQQNTTDISNDVDVNLSTGGNTASGNTGGDVSIETGDATADVDIHNAAGLNYLNVQGWSNQEDVEVVIADNGYKSDNTVDLNLEQNTTVSQNNDTNIDNNVDVNLETGDNKVGGHNNWTPSYNHDGKDYDHEKKMNHSDYDKKDDYKKDHSDYDWNKDHKKFSDYNHNNDYDKKDDHDKKYDNNKYSQYKDMKNHAKDYWLSKYYNDRKDDHKKKYDLVKKDYDHDKKYDDHDKKSYDYGKKHAKYAKFMKNYDWNKDYKKANYQHDKFDKNDCNGHDRNYEWMHNKYWDNNKSHWGNTGGDVSIQTGDANADVSIQNMASSNFLLL